MYEMGVYLRQLKRIRMRKAISQKHMAELAGVTRATIARAESGGTTSFRNAHKIADALGVSVEELQEEDEDHEAVVA